MLVEQTTVTNIRRTLVIASHSLNIRLDMDVEALDSDTDTEKLTSPKAIMMVLELYKT